MFWFLVFALVTKAFTVHFFQKVHMKKSRHVFTTWRFVYFNTRLIYGGRSTFSLWVLALVSLCDLVLFPNSSQEWFPLPLLWEEFEWLSIWHPCHCINTEHKWGFEYVPLNFGKRTIKTVSIESIDNAWYFHKWSAINTTTICLFSLVVSIKIWFLILC